MTDSATPEEPTTTVVHLMRHGEVYNPQRVLYGRLEGFHLSDLGREMAQIVADHLEFNDITHVVASPLERAQETAAPIAATHELPVATDERVIEAGQPAQALVGGAVRADRGADAERDRRCPTSGIRSRGGHREPPAARLDRPEQARAPSALARPARA